MVQSINCSSWRKALLRLCLHYRIATLSRRDLGHYLDMSVDIESKLFTFLTEDKYSFE